MEESDELSATSVAMKLRERDKLQAREKRGKEKTTTTAS
jgi:hypothetical protein